MSAKHVTVSAWKLKSVVVQAYRNLYYYIVYPASFDIIIAEALWNQSKKKHIDLGNLGMLLLLAEHIFQLYILKELEGLPDNTGTLFVL